MVFWPEILVLTLIKGKLDKCGICGSNPGQRTGLVSSKGGGGKGDWERFKKPNSQMQCVNFDWIWNRKKITIARHFMEQRAP